ncbi:MAG: hypothetical protein RIQ94_561 [Pseudomonadota bacterium]|jgi:ubiquinone/menaquinone biosynthesis C-methylase UbiE
MSSIEQKNDYWVTFWTTHEIIKAKDPQCQIGRTVNKISIDQQKWQFHLDEIEEILCLCPDDTLIDLCAGNGLITMPLSLRCQSVTAVDISNTLLEYIDTQLYPNITLITEDARNMNLPTKAFSKGLMYSALQYFNEHEIIGIFAAIYQFLKRDGLFLVGDIPDIDRLFVYHNKPEWVRAYFDSVKNNNPVIGTWFKKDILVAMAKYVGFNEAVVINQHPDLINSHYRFDLLLKK